VSDLEVDPTGKMLRIATITPNVSALRQGKYQWSTVGTPENGVWTDLSISQVTPPGQVTGNQSVLQNWIMPTGPIGTYQFRVYYEAASGLSACLSDVEILTITGTVLAIPKLLSFTGASVSTGVKLSWTMEKDDEVNKYEIMKADENGIFRTIAIWMPQGTTIQVSYNYNDLSAITRGSYQLKIIGTTGETNYSNVITVKKIPSKTLEIELSPNPVVNMLKIILHGSLLTGKEKIVVKDIMGRVVTVPCNSSTLDVSRLSSGIYYLTVMDKNNNILTTTFIKQ
jgi:Secretion system C-terminal sorting domain